MPETDKGVTGDEDIPSISAMATGEVAARRLEAVNRARWARPYWWGFLVVLELKNQGLLR